MDYVTLEEAAKLEGIEYSSIKSRLCRDSTQYNTITEPSPTGGKPRVKIAVESLSNKAQSLWRKQSRIDTMTPIKEQSTDNVPWYVDCDIEGYKENNRESFYRAVDISRVIEECIGYRGRNKTEFAERAAEKLGISVKTLYRLRDKYLEGEAWALKQEKEDGFSRDIYKILALCRKPQKGNKFPSLSVEVKAYIENIWFNKDFARNKGTVDLLYDFLGEMCRGKGIDFPSYKTVARYVNYLMEGNRNAHFLAANGEREYKNKVMLKARRDTKSVPVMGLLQGDEHTFDFWVKYTHPNGRVTAIRPTLAAWIDTRSRRFMGCMICVKANSQVLKQSILKLIYTDGMPEYLLIDNGRDYTAQTMTGHNRKDRAAFDAECKGFYRAVGIKDDFRALPYQAWTKGQIERAFGTVCNKFSKRFTSYTGTLTGSRTDAKIKKDINGMLERGELIEFDEVLPLFEKWLAEKYDVRRHDGLAEMKDEYRTPKDMFEKCSERYVKAPPPREYAVMLMMKAEHVRVYNVGIKKFGYIYNSVELASHIGENVDIRYDENDVTRIYVFDSKTGHKLCEAVSHELLAIAPRVPQKALEEHIKMQRQQLKADREAARYFATPLEERIDEHNNAAYGRADGALDLMIKGKEPKTVSMPKDEQYAEEIRTRRDKRNEKKENDFFRTQAQSALEQIRAAEKNAV